MNYQLLEKEFEIACVDSSKRQEFLDNIDFGPLKYVQRLIYKKFQKNQVLMNLIIPIFNFSSRKYKILIYPLAFDKRIHENVYDFLNALYYHEGFHTIQIKDKHPEMKAYRDLRASYLSEIDAYREAVMELKTLENQINHLNEKNSVVFKSWLTKKYDDTKKAIDYAKKEFNIRD